MKLHGIVSIVVAVFILSLPGMYFWNNGKTISWDGPGILASEDQEDQDNPMVDMFCLKGLMYLSDGKHDKAIAAYSEAIKLDPKYSFSYIGRGDVYLDIGDLDRALRDYEHAARLDPDNDTAKERASLVRSQQKRK